MNMKKICILFITLLISLIAYSFVHSQENGELSVLEYNNKENLISWSSDYKVEDEVIISLLRGRCSDELKEFVTGIKTIDITNNNIQKSGKYSADIGLDRNKFLSNELRLSDNYCIQIVNNYVNERPEEILIDVQDITQLIQDNIIFNNKPNQNYLVEIDDSDYSIENILSEPSNYEVNVEVNSDIISFQDNAFRIVNSQEEGTYQIEFSVNEVFTGNKIYEGLFYVNIMENLASDETFEIKTFDGWVTFLTQEEGTIEFTGKGLTPSAVNLYLSRDGQDWIRFGTFDEIASQVVSVDVEPGEYLLRAELDLGVETKINTVADINVLNSNSNIDFILRDTFGIDSIEPPIDTESENSDIAVDFVLDLYDEELINSILVIDDRDVPDACSLEEELLSCQIMGLSSGQHELKLILITDKGSIVGRDFIFNVVNNSQDTPVSVPTILPSDFELDFSNWSGRIIIAVSILLVGIVLIAIPWLLFRKINNRRNSWNAEPDYSSFAAQGINRNTLDKSSNKVNVNQQNQNSQTKEDEFINPYQNNPISSASEGPALPSSYTSEELPEWLRGGSSNPVGTSGGDYKTSKPIEGDQPYGMPDYRKGNV